MSTYAIGDVQGCFEALQRLIEAIAFDAASDHLLFAGDLVNRGPDSLGTLRYLRSLGDRCSLVLGNHDLHLLAVSAGVRSLKPGDTLTAVLDAPDQAELVDYLRQQPLLLQRNGYLMVHAGLLPHWTVSQAQQQADGVQQRLRAADYPHFLARLYEPLAQQATTADAETVQLRLAVDALTRLRFLNPDQTIELGYKGNKADAPPQLIPWFEAPGRKSADTPIIFGHWSALSSHPLPPTTGGQTPTAPESATATQPVFCLDTGCVWGGYLTAMRLEDRRFYQVRCDNSGRINPR